MVGKIRDRGETGSAGGMTTPLTWIAGLSGLLQSSIVYFNNNTQYTQLNRGTVKLHRSATVNTVASTMYTTNQPCDELHAITSMHACTIITSVHACTIITSVHACTIIIK